MTIPTQAHSCLEIIETLAKIEWKKESSDGEPPIPAIKDLLSISPEHFRVEAPGFLDMLTCLGDIFGLPLKSRSRRKNQSFLSLKKNSKRSGSLSICFSSPFTPFAKLPPTTTFQTETSEILS